MEPLEALEAAVGEPVTVRLKDGSAHRGELAGFDQHMNLVLAVLDESGDGAGVDDGAGATEVGGTTVIRGDNVVTLNR